MSSSSRFFEFLQPSVTLSSKPNKAMAAQSKVFYSAHQPTGAGDDEAAARNYLSRKKFKRPISPSPDFESHQSTTVATVCELSSSETDRAAQEYRYSLIARVVGKDIRSWQLAGRLHRHLRLTDDVQVFELGLGYFVLKFSETDFQALQYRPWPIPNLCIYAVPWAPNFKPSETPISTVDAWIRLHELSIEYYDEEILRRIAESIGYALVMIDPVTKDRRKCKYARICVRINLCGPLPSTIKIGSIRQEIEYEGFDLLCPKCNRVIDLKHDCLHNPSVSSRFDSQYRRSDSFQATGSRYHVVKEESKAPLLDLNEWPSLSVRGSERAAARTSRSSLQPQLPGLVAEPSEKQKEKCEISVQTLPKESARREKVPQSYPISISSNPEAVSTSIEVPVELEQTNLIPSIALKDHPMSMSSNPEVASTTIKGPAGLEQKNLTPSIAFHDHPMSISSYPEAGTSTTTPAPAELVQNKLIPSIALSDHTMSISSNSEAAASTTITASTELKQSNLNQSMALAPCVLKDQFRATETGHSTTPAVHNNQPQPSLSNATIPSIQPSPTSKTVRRFCPNGLECSLIKKEITSTPSKGISINCRPILYTVDSPIKSLPIGLSESPDSVPKQNQIIINIVSTSSGNDPRIGSHSKKMLCWNFRGIDNANLIEGLKYMVQKYEISIVVIFGTRISDDVVEEVVDELAFYGSFCKKYDDYNRGVWLLMFRRDLQTEVFEVNSYSPQQVSASAYFQTETNEPLVGFSYADTETSSLQAWAPASFCASTHSMANALAY